MSSEAGRGTAAVSTREAAITLHQVSKFYPLPPDPRARLLELLIRYRKPRPTGVWALREVSFEVPKGCATGVVGDNGSGKSTLLQIVAGTLSPTSGSVQVRGRVAALLELGAGFNPEFSGRENVFSSAAVLGFGRRETERRLPEIIDFAELGPFIDQPVKTYSSGMYVRLAFSVATLLDPTVLLIDEILAVGDQHFQKKCVDRIERFRRSGGSILFCSHNMYQVKQLCDRAVWLKEGRVEATGPSAAVVDEYVNFVRLREATPSAETVARLPRAEEKGAWVREVVVRDDAGAPRTSFRTGEGMRLTVDFSTDRQDRPVHVGVGIFRNDRVICYGVTTLEDGLPPLVVPGAGSITFRVRALPLLPGSYHVTAALLDEHGLHVYDLQEYMASFTVTHPRNEIGLCRLEHEWIPAEG